MDERLVTLKEHLIELRKRVVISATFLLFTTIISIIFIQKISAFLVRIAGGVEIIYISPTEAFMTELRIAIFSGVFLALPVILSQVWAFICPGLKKNERRKFLFVLFFSLLLFLYGTFFAYSIALPFTMRFLSNFSPSIAPLFSYQAYISFITSLILIFGVVFQLPLIIMTLIITGLVTVATLRRVRKYVIVVMFVVAAIITPPDVISQVVMVLPLLVLYEVGILVGHLLNPARKRKRDDDSSEL
ncbi:MAG: twin-arginine translocase subunit TatC [Firmicutes bacterium]|nr:twin-arginine translocase subunit TatC [Bacillota bacterium]